MGGRRRISFEVTSVAKYHDAHDPSQRKRIDEPSAIYHKEAFLRTILKTLPDLIWLKSPEGVYLACNSLFERFMGAKEADILGKTDYDFFDRERADIFRAHDRRAMEAGKSTTNEEEIIFADDGHHAMLETIKTPMFNADGGLIGVLGISRDITDRKKMEEELGHSALMHGVLWEIAEAAMRSRSMEELFKTVHHLIGKILPAELFHINFVDDAACETWMPYCAEALTFIPRRRPNGNGLTEYVMQLGQTVYLRPADLDRLRAAMQYFLPEMPTSPIRHYLASPLMDSDNKPFGSMAVMLMGDEREFRLAEEKIFSVIAAQVSIAIKSKQADEAMRESERLFANAFSYAPVGMLLISPAGLCRRVNQAACRLLGYEADELLGLNILDLIHPEDLHNIFEYRRRLIAGEIESYQLERRYLTKSKSIVWALASASMVRNAAGAPQYVIVQMEDISERKRLEQELRQHAGQLEETVERRTQELFAANQELMAVNEELTQMNEQINGFNAMLETSNRQLREEAIARLEKETELLLRESQYRAASTLLISSSASTEEQMREAIQDALRMVKAPIGYIGLYDANSGIFDIQCAIGPEEFIVNGSRAVNQGMLGEAFQNGEIVYAPDCRSYPQYQPETDLARISSMIMIPLKKSGQVMGGLAVAWLDDVHAVSEEEIEVLRQYGNLVSIALERNDTQMRMERKNRLLQGLAETTAALMGELELDAVLQSILAKAMELVEIPHGFVLQVGEPDPCEITFRAGHGSYRDRIGQRESWRSGVFMEMLRTGRMVIVEDYAAWPLGSAESKQKGVSMSMQSPLQVDGKIIGAIGLTAYGEKVAMNPDKAAAFEQFAYTASIAVKNALHLERIRKLAYEDSLTGLPNRAGLFARLEREMELARRGEAVGAVLFIDLDDLKTVNDHFGHTSGDVVIVTAGSDIVGAAGAGAFVARVGGDEFVVILPDADHIENIAQIADRLVDSLRREYEVQGRKIHMSTSIGVTLYPQDGDAAEEILKNADIAMYAAKAAGKNRWRLYEQGMQQEAYEKMVITGSLRHALESGELYLQYQPLISMPEERVGGFEALLRWNSREHGVISPERFIPLAEQSGLIISIGQWVFGEACRFARSLADSGRQHVHVAVNVSPRQLAAEDFVDMVRRSLDEAGIQPQQLEVEITESVLIESLADSNRKLAELSALGVQLALDDFGTGYSSLTYLRNLPVKTLKIDKSFIDGMLEDKVQEGFIGSIINMAHVLGLKVVAEGVETESQLMRLMQMGCDCVQGYVFSKPVARDAAIHFCL